MSDRLLDLVLTPAAAVGLVYGAVLLWRNRSDLPDAVLSLCFGEKADRRN